MQGVSRNKICIKKFRLNWTLYPVLLYRAPVYRQKYEVLGAFTVFRSPLSQLMFHTSPVRE